MVSPAIETITRAFCSTSQGKSWARNASIPGPCRPIELSIPEGVSAMRGVGRPWRGFVITDLVTIAPTSLSAKNWDNSFPLLAQPLAVKIGVGNQALPSVVDISTGRVTDEPPECVLRDPIEHEIRPSLDHQYRSAAWK